ncbi:MAG: phosphoenolpyruvate carboxykinase (GTP), phosphoenolpyruvate carboxykinase (GTP) [Candidatus Peregrinibacteria bacterium GW2011_GWE2_39_6]|nr:MAG: phosphoenolpyruvate carboxykinase (GTP), phosphoenolpyruvate carboxykinase (GTP) [Candidatus Peregrinibacteria bacterium GW2011_GWE2_39_6]
MPGQSISTPFTTIRSQSVILEKILSIFVIIAIGFAAKKVKAVDAAFLRGLSAFMMNIALPFAFIASLDRSIPKSVLPELGMMALWSIAIHGAAIGFATIAYRRFPEGQRKILSFITVFTNCALTPDGDVWWEGIGWEAPAGTASWKDAMADRSSSKASAPGAGPLAHPNARFTVPASSCPSMDEAWEDPAGVPISAIIFGGRRSTTVPLVYESRSWRHGVFLGATLSSETTAAAAGQVGRLRRDPFAMLPFCGYNIGDYFAHWMSFGRKPSLRLPRVFHVNWFRKDGEGKFLWPGYSENARVLKWMFERCDGTVQAADSPIGYMPLPGDFDAEGLGISADSVKPAAKNRVLRHKAEHQRQPQQQQHRIRHTLVEHHDGEHRRYHRGLRRYPRALDARRRHEEPVFNPLPAVMQAPQHESDDRKPRQHRAGVRRKIFRPDSLEAGVQRAHSGPARHSQDSPAESQHAGQRHDKSRHLAVSHPETVPGADDQTRAAGRGQRARRAPAVLHLLQHRRHRPGKTRHGTHRQIDVAGHYHQRHAQRHDGHRHRLQEEVGDVPRRDEDPVGKRAHYHPDGHQRQQHGVLADVLFEAFLKVFPDRHL